MIYLIAGHSKIDPGAIGAGGVKESDLAIELRGLIGAELTKLNQKFVVDNDSDNLRKVISKLNTTEKDVICDIHFNASSNPTATGAEVIIPDRRTASERMIAGLICSAMALTMNIRSRGVKSEKDTARGSLGIMRPSGINLLLEVCFISNKSDLDLYQQHKERIANRIALHLTTAEGLHK
jgi:N-acetylmuramoyl-L-alanine amidase